MFGSPFGEKKLQRKLKRSTAFLSFLPRRIMDFWGNGYEFWGKGFE